MAPPGMMPSLHPDLSRSKSGDVTHVIIVTSLMMLLMTSVLGAPQAIDLTRVDGKSLFLTLRASACSVNCVTSKVRPVCGTDDVTYTSRCELKRAKKCDGKRVKVNHKGHCIPAGGHSTRCVQDRQEAVAAGRLHDGVLVPTCDADGTYAEVQCHTSTNYCWCVTRDGRHIPGTSVKHRRPRCKGQKRKKKSRGGKTRRKKPCSNKDRQTFNTALIKVFKEEYDREHDVTQGDHGEKAIVTWKFDQLDINKDGDLKFKEIRNFGRMVRKLIPPRACAKRFLKHCDKNNNRVLEGKEWTLGLGVDIKTSDVTGGSRHVTPSLADVLPRQPRPPPPYLRPSDRDVTTVSRDSLSHALPMLSTRGAESSVDRGDRAEKGASCRQEREDAITFHGEEPNAKPFIPVCDLNGRWEAAQCHSYTGYCWCVQEATGIPIPGTATYNVTPECTFDNEREMKGCPFEQKRRFLVDLIGDLTTERRTVLMEGGNHTSTGPEDNLSLRETVARWKLKTLDKNKNGVLERKEWRPLRKVTLKAKHYPRRCRRSFLRYCDEDKDKKISWEEWKDCLGLNHISSSSLPRNRTREGEKNPFMDQLT